MNNLTEKVGEMTYTDSIVISELDRMISEWCDIYLALDKRTKEAKDIRKVILKIEGIKLMYRGGDR
jgi:hypothetical protein